MLRNPDDTQPCSPPDGCVLDELEKQIEDVSLFSDSEQRYDGTVYDVSPEIPPPRMT